MYRDDIALLNETKSKKPIRSYLLKKSKEIKKRREEEKANNTYSIRRTRERPVENIDMPRLRRREDMPPVTEKKQENVEGFRPVPGLKKRPVLPGPPIIEEKPVIEQLPKIIKKKVPENEIQVTAIYDMINGFVEMTLSKIDTQSNQRKIHVFSATDVKEIMKR